MTERIECCVIGAGVVGLAIARALALQGREVIVLETAETIGTETSSRNSEVIHAGIYYPKDSLKAEFCVKGRHQLYDYCRTHGIAHANCGKLIVASVSSQEQTLEGIQSRALANGVDDLEWLGANSVSALEPDIRATAALLSPSTGIIDSHGYMLSLQGEAEEAGTMIAFGSPVVGGQVEASGIRLDVGGDQPMSITGDIVINSAGLHAPEVAGSISGIEKTFVPQAYYAKGNYFVHAGRTPFKHLIYPVPEEGGLGVHVTLDLQGNARFGPDVEWRDDINYDVDLARADVFYDAVRQYWPDLRDGALLPGYAGVRPKISGPGMDAADFVLSGPSDHGIKGLVNLFGIESPGLTASLAIADAVAAQVEN
ncbi:MAG: NAD(P)/FAD-dependent oxidoreductase [Proteobacteria bacterium]|nr:NAD(P)/FAD-dependent oxidoreductase [Pseudomonadota bacterium]